ncbi:hypothetical protein SAMN05421876_102215 [Kaistella jeonii]|nr:hypothetical protein SAMN05421876_102215 [Kaistella jeonii]VEI96298.1 Uncharacterised protein [Kaistella jeonii]
MEGLTKLLIPFLLKLTELFLNRKSQDYLILALYFVSNVRINLSFLR